MNRGAADSASKVCTGEPPPHLRFQRYQFAHIWGRFQKRCYRSQLKVAVPATVEECHNLIPKLARKVYMASASVDVADLVQIGELVFHEELSRLGRSIIQKPAVALRILMESIQSAMFHAIDQHAVALPGQRHPEADDDIEYDPAEQAERLPIAECSVTVKRDRNSWEFLEERCKWWGVTPPGGSCQANPTPLCACPQHLPIVVTVGKTDTGLEREKPPDPEVGGGEDPRMIYCWAAVR